MNLLLLSNSTQHGRGYLEHAIDTVTAFLPDGARLAFVPYALADYTAYTTRVREALESAASPSAGSTRTPTRSPNSPRPTPCSSAAATPSGC